ncbi:MAG: calcium-binding protein, partial [Betaproteobacteria bacterium]|nr:calcium-binding protein [Betaproteobacteria bacterium]
GADVIDGGAGVDTAVYAAGATFALNPSTSKWEVTGGEDSTTDALQNVEVIKIGNVANLVGSLAVVQNTVSSLEAAGSLPADFNAIIIDAAGAPLAASALSALGGKTTGVVTVSNAVVISGKAAEVTAALVTADTLVQAGSAKVTVTDSIAVSAVNAIASKTSGVITATITEGGVATLKTLTGTGNAYTITLTDTSADIADLIAMNERTSVPVDAQSVATITSASTTIIDLTAAGVTWKSGITVSGTAGSDSIYATAGADSITGGAGNDSITAGAGNDTIVGADSGDTIVGGVGSDTLQLSGNYTPAADGNLQEVESVVVTGNAAAVTVNLSNQSEAFTVLLSGLGDSVTTGSGADNITGGTGVDTLDGGSGADTLTGGAGADTFKITSGTDTVTDLGTGGADVLLVSTAAAVNATVTAAWTATSASSNSGTANLSTSGLAVNLAAITGGTTGFTVKNTGAGTTLTGSALADSLKGGSGNDTLTGGAGADVIDGGAGVDTAVYVAGATIALNPSTLKWEVTGGEDSTTDVVENVEVIKIGNVSNLVGSLAVV